MKLIKLLSAFVILATFQFTSAQAQDMGGVYELRTYHTHEGKLEPLLTRFKDYEVALFNKHGMESVGYFVAQDQPNTLVYILKHKSRESAAQSWKGFFDDPEWKKVAEESKNKDGQLLDSAPVVVFLSPTGFSPLK
ncbi:MAG: NIPSNAP family protein [Kordiimonadaceae bacterium]|nr:NIPSNAP family protein [Kordiimonadaceae bacterium]